MSQVKLGLDASGMSAAAGYIKGMSEEIETDRSISSIVGYVQGELSRRFNMAVDLAAEAAPQSFLHVYEWGNSHRDYTTVGSPVHRLWKLNQIGSGRNRVVSFVFLPSVKPVPIHDKLKGIVKEDVHVFTWKAPVMEYGIRVTISPRWAKVLVFVDNITDEIRRSKGPFSFKSGMSPHGRPQQKGMFTSFFIAWWRTEGPNIFQNELVPNIENEVFPENRLLGLSRRYQRKTKQFNIQTSLQGHRTFASARSQAHKDMKATVKDLRRETTRRMVELYGD